MTGLFCRVPSSAKASEETKQSEIDVAPAAVPATSDTIIDTGVMQGEGLEGELSMIQN